MNIGTSILLTDLYQLTMLQAYRDNDMNRTATFEYYIRELPDERQFLIAAGLEQALDYLENAHFEPEEIDALSDSGIFKPEFLKELIHFKFEGDVRAMPEGTVFFPNEPIIRITAPLPQAQLVETRVLNLLHFQTTIASKAARIVLASRGRTLADFGFRRAHGGEAGLLAARASYLAGFDGTATVLAGSLFGIPLSGTMAHSFVQACDSEEEAFERYARSFPGNVVLLIDTYDVMEAAKKVVQLSRKLISEGIAIKAIRIDSGDLLELSRAVRDYFDRNGLESVRIIASGDMDEYSIRDLLEQGAPIDRFGVGTRMVVSADAPYLNSGYKLQEYDGLLKRKLSTGKATLPGAKQVFRRYDANGTMIEDILAMDGDRQEGNPLIRLVMSGGRRIEPSPPLTRSRERAREEIASLPERLKRIDLKKMAYPVVIAPSLVEKMRDDSR